MYVPLAHCVYGMCDQETMFIVMSLSGSKISLFRALTDPGALPLGYPERKDSHWGHIQELKIGTASEGETKLPQCITSK